MTTAAHLPAAQRAIAGEALLSPARIAVWERLADVAEHGVAQLVQWGPADGLPHPAERPSHQHTMPTLTICLRGQVRVIGREMIDLKPGDVVTRIEGMPIEHPEEAIEAFHALEAASELRVDYERDGVPRTLRYQIVDDEGTTAAPLAPQQGKTNK